MNELQFSRVLLSLQGLDPSIIAYLQELQPLLSDEQRTKVLAELKPLNEQLQMKQLELTKIYKKGGDAMKQYLLKNLPSLARKSEQSQKMRDEEQAEELFLTM